MQTNVFPRIKAWITNRPASVAAGTQAELQVQYTLAQLQMAPTALPCTVLPYTAMPYMTMQAPAMQVTAMPYVVMSERLAWSLGELQPVLYMLRTGRFKLEIWLTSSLI